MDGENDLENHLEDDTGPNGDDPGGADNEEEDDDIDLMKEEVDGAECLRHLPRQQCQRRPRGVNRKKPHQKKKKCSWTMRRSITERSTTKNYGAPWGWELCTRGMHNRQGSHQPPVRPLKTCGYRSVLESYWQVWAIFLES